VTCPKDIQERKNVGKKSLTTGIRMLASTKTETGCVLNAVWDLLPKKNQKGKEKRKIGI